MSGKGKSYLSMGFVNIAWGLSFILSKQALTAGFPPMTLALIRYVFASALLLMFTLKADKRLAIQKGDWPLLGLSGVLGITLYYYFEYSGISLTSTVSASMILAAIPIMTMLAETAVLRLPMTFAKALGALMSLSGVALIVIFGANGGAGNVKGDLFIFGASLTWVGYLFACKRLRKRYTSLQMNTLQALSALITLFPLALMERGRWVPVPLSGWVSAFLLAAVCSALCYWLYGNALSVLTPLSSAIFINLIPLTTIIAGVAFLSEPVAPLQILGGALIVASIFIVTLNAGRNTAPAHDAPAQNLVDRGAAA